VGGHRLSGCRVGLSGNRGKVPVHFGIELMMTLPLSLAYFPGRAV